MINVTSKKYTFHACWQWIREWSYRTFSFLLKTLLIISYSLAIAIIGTIGFFFFTALMPLVIIAFSAGFLSEGIGIGSNYILKFIRNIVNPDHYKREYLTDLLIEEYGNQSNKKNDPLKYFFEMHHAINDHRTKLKKYYDQSGQLEKKLNELKQKEKITLQNIIENINSIKSDNEHGILSETFENKNPLKYPISNYLDDQEIEKIIATFSRCNFLKKLAIIPSLLAGATFGLGLAPQLGLMGTIGIHATLLYHITAFVGLGGLITCLGPVGLGIVVAIAAIGYFMVVHQSIVELGSNEFIIDLWQKFKACCLGKSDASPKKKALVISGGILFLLIIIGLTVLSAGSFWCPITVIIGPMIMGLFALGSIGYKLSTTSETLKVIFSKIGNPFKRLWNEMKDKWNHGIDQLKELIEKESFLELINPIRLIKHLAIGVISKLLFWVHFIPVGTSVDRFAHYKLTNNTRTIMAALGTINDIIEDIGPYFTANIDLEEDDDNGMVEQVIWWIFTPVHAVDCLWRIFTKSLSYIFCSKKQDKKDGYWHSVWIKSFYLSFLEKDKIEKECLDITSNLISEENKKEEMLDSLHENHHEIKNFYEDNLHSNKTTSNSNETKKDTNYAKIKYISPENNIESNRLILTHSPT